MLSAPVPRRIASRRGFALCASQSPAHEHEQHLPARATAVCRRFRDARFRPLRPAAAAAAAARASLAVLALFSTRSADILYAIKLYRRHSMFSLCVVVFEIAMGPRAAGDREKSERRRREKFSFLFFLFSGDDALLASSPGAGCAAPLRDRAPFSCGRGRTRRAHAIHLATKNVFEGWGGGRRDAVWTMGAVRGRRSAGHWRSARGAWVSCAGPTFCWHRESAIEARAGAAEITTMNHVHMPDLEHGHLTRVRTQHFLDAFCSQTSMQSSTNKCTSYTSGQPMTLGKRPRRQRRSRRLALYKP